MHKFRKGDYVIHHQVHNQRDDLFYILRVASTNRAGDEVKQLIHPDDWHIDIKTCAYDAAPGNHAHVIPFDKVATSRQELNNALSKFRWEKDGMFRWARFWTLDEALKAAWFMCINSDFADSITFVSEPKLMVVCVICSAPFVCDAHTGQDCVHCGGNCGNCCFG